jgi:hypothetical protein
MQSNSNYTGDQATVLPDNTNAILHFSSILAQKEQQRQAQQLAEERAEEARKNALQRYLGDKLTSKDFHEAHTFQGIVDTGILKILDDNKAALSSGVPVDQVYADAVPQVETMRSKALRAKELFDNNATGVSNILKHDPYVDAGTLADLTAHNASYGPDGKLKDLTQVDPSHPYADEAYQKYASLLYSPKMITKATDDYFNSQKLADVNEPQQIDANGKLIRQGFKGKLPAFVHVLEDENGKAILNQDGTPKVDLFGAQYYKLPGETTDYRDDKGQKVKVVSDEVFKTLYQGPFRAGIESKVNDVLTETNLSPDSEYANMLRKKFLYDKLETEATNRYKFTIPEDKSAAVRNQLLGRQLQEANLSLSRQRLDISKDRAAMAKLKAANGGDNAPEPLTDNYEGKAGKTIPNPLTGQDMKIIKVSDIDKNDLQLITGNRVSSIAGESPDNVKPFDLGRNGSVFMIDNNGDWYGQDKDGKLKLIDREAAYKRQVNYGKKGIPEVKAPPKKNMVQKVIDKVKQAVTPTKTSDNPLGI